MDALAQVFETADDCLDKATVMELMADGLDARYSKDAYIVGYVIRELRDQLEKLRANLTALDNQLHQR